MEMQTMADDGLPISGEKEPTKRQPKPEEPPWCFIVVILVLSILGVVYLSIGVVHFLGGHWHRWFGPYDPVEYNVNIAAVSGLDPAKKDLAALLYPASNLTLVVASPSTAKRRECVEAGTTVELSYPRSGGVPLATGRAPAFCVEVGERREEGSIVAWGQGGVRLPGLVLDSLAADMRRGAPEFGVKLTPPPLPDLYCGSGTVDVISCLAEVGAGPAPCVVSREEESPFHRCHVLASPIMSHSPTPENVTNDTV